MTHALEPVAAMYQQEGGASEDQSKHPHAPAGSPQGGQFATKSTSSTKTAPAAARKKVAPRRQVRKPGAKPAAKAAPAPAAAVTSTLSRKGPNDPAQVRTLQHLLAGMGFGDVAEDGVFGPKTEAAVKALQAKLGTRPTGHASPTLARRLGDARKLSPCVKASAEPELIAASVEYAHTEAHHYADMGYQSDGKKRYALDSEAECRAAWSYINMPKNAAKYSAEDLAKVKSAIKAAGRKYGIEFASDVKASGPDLLGVELARPGVWKLKTGETMFSAQMLRDAGDFFAASGGQGVPIKLGHSDARFDGDGEPTFGVVTNVRYAEDDRGPVLLGDITGMPGWLAASAPTRWPNRSIEGWQDFTYDGREYSLVLSGLAFLGVTPPGVRNIKSLADLQIALAASAARHLVASAPDDDQAEPPQSPAPEAVVPTSPKETGMDPAKFREALGLDDASDDEVMEALAAAGFVPQSEPPKDGPEAQPIAASAVPPGMIVLASSVWDENQKTIKTLSDFVAKSKRNERDEIIAKAIQAGKFTPAQRKQISDQWDLNPDATRSFIDIMTPNAQLAVMASGYAGDVEGQDDELDREIARLSPPGKAA
jgi:peptidoglycan hydrolase-like protein with peptidoglycan-binding domain